MCKVWWSGMMSPELTKAVRMGMGLVGAGIAGVGDDRAARGPVVL